MQASVLERPFNDLGRELAVVLYGTVDAYGLKLREVRTRTRAAARCPSVQRAVCVSPS